MTKPIQQDPIDPDLLALDNCDREPIHRPGRVQPFGALVAGPMDLSRIDFASENAAEVIGIDARALLGTPMRDHFGSELVHGLRNVLSVSTSRTQRERVGRFEMGGRVVEAFVHRNPADQAVVEFEPFDGADEVVTASPIDQTRMMLAQAGQQRDLKRFLHVCVLGLRELIGYDRVMAYRYSPNGDGEVVAEVCAPGVESFLGLRYPAWDVPAQARALQVRNPVRMLSDVEQEPVALLGHAEDPATLDIALAHTRGVSPIHVEYLRNMGVGATLTIGLVVEGRLWGMFACHHMSRRVIRSDLRIAAELFGQMISLVIQQKQEIEASEARNRAGEARRRILTETNAAGDLLSAFPDMAPILRDVIACDGLAVLSGAQDDEPGTLRHVGSVPSEAAIRFIASGLDEDAGEPRHTEALADSGWGGAHDLNQSAGCLAVPCPAATPLHVLFFRDAKVRNVRWAGKPRKDITLGPNGARLSPRGSFAAYLEEQSGCSPEWTASDVEAGDELRKVLAQITSKSERAQLLRHKDMVTHQRQQDLMIAELNHRVKNILALIRSLSRQAKASSQSLESYAQALEQRISALAAAHDIAVSSNAQGVPLRGILEAELRPYLDGDAAQVVCAGPTVGLRADVAPMIALVFHEIVTNAAKYGALSTGEGIVQAKWSLENDGDLVFSWKELGGPEVAPPTRHGFGRSLIEKAIPYEFDGEVELTYAPGGAAVRFRLPARTLADPAEVEGKVIDNALVGEIGKIEKVANGASALMVEDNVVLAMDMVDSLTRLGAEQVETAGSVEEAIRAVREKAFDFAVLDMNLRGTVSFDVARALREKRTPFIFVTGYGSSIEVPEALDDVPILAKPIDDSSLSACLGRLLG